jgi:CRISPR-associated endonuclease/helicase Cas3
MSKGMTKAERLDRMKLLYCQRAYSDVEMSERLGVDRSTIYRDRIDLEREHPFVEEEGGRYRIDRQRYISNVRLNMPEALSLYLAARRASQQTRYAHERTASALEKIAIALHQPMTQRLVNAAERILAQRSDPRRVTIFETVAQAWVESLQLRVDYRPLHGQRARTHRFDPYLLEPSPWSDSIYVIGHSDLARRVITLKLERIERAVLGERFERPEHFDEQAMLRHAWGVWGNDEEPQTVTLRIAPGTATRRLKETIWHPLERITDTEDGGCIWEAEIAEWREMLPWVRGWGADVEVLAPRELRESVIGGARALLRLYKLEQQRNADSSTVEDFFGE